MTEITLNTDWLIGKCKAGKLRVCGTIDEHPTREEGELIRSREVVSIEKDAGCLIAKTKTAVYELPLQ